MRYSGTGLAGRYAAWIASWFYPPYKAGHQLAKMSRAGYIAFGATLYHSDLSIGHHVFIGDRVIIFDKGGAGSFALGDDVSINRDTIIEGGAGGSLIIGDVTTIQPGCVFAAYKGPIVLGKEVQIAPNCAFYPYNHGMSADHPMKEQPLFTRGGIHIEDDVWLGYGVVVLDGVRIGRGSVIGAGSVVNRDIPAGVIAAGVPARVIKERASTDQSDEQL
jgi:acetyltransferase-like isoleucine patch superfamily enzyme